MAGVGGTGGEGGKLRPLYLNNNKKMWKKRKGYFYREIKIAKTEKRNHCA